MSNNPPAGNMPGGYPNFHSLQRFLTPERLAFIRNDPEQLAFVKEFSAKLASDPVFMKSVEAMLREHSADLGPSNMASFELASFGWSPAPDLPSPKHAAAAVGAAAAALVVPVPV